MTFPRVLYWDDNLNKNKYIFQKEYRGWGIYYKKCPSGYYVHQEYLITNGEMKIIIQSYNNYCEEEILDMIDADIECNKMNVKVFKKNDFYIVHPSGDLVI